MESLDVVDTQWSDLDGCIEVHGGTASVALVLNRTVVIGRGQALDPGSTFVSERHAEIRLTDQGCQVRDLGSTNGTRVAGRRLQPDQWVKLSLGAGFSVANVTLRLRVLESALREPAIQPRITLDVLGLVEAAFTRMIQVPSSVSDLPWWRALDHPDAPGLLDADLPELDAWLNGYGPIQALMDDPSITEIMVLGTQPIWVERAGCLEQTLHVFPSVELLQRVIDRMLAPLGRRADRSSPLADGRLADGSRVNVVLPPVALSGPALTIRRFQRQVNELSEWIAADSIPGDVAQALAQGVEQGRDILIVGGTGAGKTTLLNALAGFIPEQARVISIEDAAELDIKHRHWARLETRSGGLDGRQGLAARDLLINALRMRPDRLLLGEVRGAEALELIQALNTGHRGCMSTLHANSATACARRLEVLLLSAGIDWPLVAVREQIAQALDLVVAIEKAPSGQRRVVEVAELVGFDGDDYQWMHHYRAGHDV
ncbi:ATPase, T2SS/T4P/T4SS family [Litorivicinus lipolyticus]|uniref:ATPase, T2SS/T4P/T4SS family n=1 Tax=Litorivicinus lipolyticus TaxID=418701 RepID=UPI003B5B1405